MFGLFASAIGGLVMGITVALGVYLERSGPLQPSDLVSLVVFGTVAGLAGSLVSSICAAHR